VSAHDNAARSAYGAGPVLGLKADAAASEVALVKSLNQRTTGESGTSLIDLMFAAAAIVTMLLAVSTAVTSQSRTRRLAEERNLAMVACRNGLRVAGGADGVGRATTVTVVTSAMFVLVSDFFLTQIFHLIF